MNVWELLEIAESTNAPEYLPEDSSDCWSDVTFEAKNGWKVVIFYDGTELDYIDHFIKPDGKIINFWDWPDEPDYYNSDKHILMCWRNVGDLERLKSYTV